MKSEPKLLANLWFIKITNWIAVKCLGQFQVNYRMGRWLEHLREERGYTAHQMDELKRKLRDRGIDFHEGRS